MSKTGKHKSKWNLPDHNPGPGVWNAISQKLDVEKPFTGSERPMNILPKHSPPADIWSGIENVLDNNKPAGVFFRFKTLLIIIILFGILATVWIFSFTPEKDIKITTDKSIDHNISVLDSKQNEIINDTQFVSKYHYLDENDKSQIIIPSRIIISETLNNKKNQNTVEQDITIDPIYSISKSTTGNDNESGHIPETKYKAIIISKLPSQSFQTYNDIGYPLTTINDHHNSADQILSIPQNSNLFKNVFVSISFTPEIAILSNHDKNHLTNHFDLSIGYKFNNAFFETGIGYNWSNCNEIIEYDYMQNEFMYKYAKVDSIIYSYDTINMEFNKEFVVSDFEVFDSIQYTDESEFSNSSKYIQIPISFGYKKKFKNISIYIKSGAVFSIRTNNKNEFQVNKSGVRIVSVQQQKYCNINSNIQLLVGAGIEFHLNKKLSTVIEPQFRYYFNNQYNNNVDNPFSIGLRAGLYFNF